MVNHYLKALDILSDELPNTEYELEQHYSGLDTGKRGEMGTPKEARAFAVGLIDELIERLQEIRNEIELMPLKRF